MASSESPTATEHTSERPNDMFDLWLRTITGGLVFQADIASALTRATFETGDLLQQQYATLGETWLQAVGGTGSVRSQDTAGSTDRPATDEQSRADSDVPAIGSNGFQPRAAETTDDFADQKRSSETEDVDATTPLNQLSAFGRKEAERLRSANVRTVKDLAAANPKALAAETGLNPSRTRVWIFRARWVTER